MKLDIGKLVGLASKVDISKIIALVGFAMSAVEKIKDARGADKEQAVVDAVQEGVPAIEEAVHLDFANDEALNRLLVNYIRARKALWNGIAETKNLRNKD